MSDTPHATLVNPLELPEILLALARYFPQKELALCSRVCKLWHQTFQPFLWENISSSAGPNNLNPTLPSIAKNAPLVKRLIIYQRILREHAAIHFPAMESLNLTLHQNIGQSDDNPGGDETSRETLMVRNHPTITRLGLSSLPTHVNIDFWIAVRDLPHLRFLFFSYSAAASRFAEMFWQACTRPELLCLNFSAVPDIPSFETYSFSRTRQLLMSYVRGGLSPQRQLKLIVNCRNLETLKWRGPPDRLPLNELSFYAAQGTWPNLHELNLEGTQVSDKDLSALLESLTRLTKLEARETGFGRCSFERLSVHFNHLVYLDVEDCNDATSPLIQAIMASCPNLIELKAPVIRGSDIAPQNEHGVGSGQPWVCTKLKKLTLGFDLDELDSQTVVLERLATLVQLECFDFGIEKDLSPGLSEPSIALSLKEGMGILWPLRRLNVLRFAGTRQDMSQDEIQWMARHWRDLEVIRGRLSEDPACHEALGAMLHKLDVITD
ncbi:hypothetical protein BGZ58_003592 [Dissophora ornata]|nr:hypothetical protein BGZ58_003592 [Dissophora ornata]